MTRILILGGYGNTGRLLAKHLLAHSDAEVVIAGRSVEKAQSYAAELGASYARRVTAQAVDAASGPALREALRGVNLLAVAAPTMQHAQTVIRAALEAGADYLDVQLDARKTALLQSLAPEIERAGRCFITEAGFHPGLPSALVRYAATQLEPLESAVVAGCLNQGPTMPYSEGVDELMGLFQDFQAQIFTNGAWTSPRTYQRRRFDFGPPLGERACFSMFFEELRELPAQLPTLRELGFFMAGSHWFVDWVLTPIVLGGLKVAPRRGVRPLGKLLWWGMQTFPKPPYLVALKLEARGTRNGRPAALAATISHADGYEMTAVPVAATLLQYLDGTARRPGLWMMGHLPEPVRLFKDMERIGLTITSAYSAA